MFEKIGGMFGLAFYAAQAAVALFAWGAMTGIFLVLLVLWFRERWRRWKLEERLNQERVICRLCKGTGNDVTGRAINGSPTPVCVRCGGYGTVPPRGWNPSEITRGEMNRIERERKARHV